MKMIIVLLSIIAMNCYADDPRISFNSNGIQVSKSDYSDNSRGDTRVNVDFRSMCVKTSINKYLSLGGIGGSIPLLNESFNTCLPSDSED